MNIGPELVDGAWVAVDPLPEPEVDSDGYLLESWLEAFRAHQFSPPAAALFMRETFPLAANLMISQATVTDFEDDWGESGKRITFHTAGWSGAEELVAIALDHLWISQLHVQWRRGGHYIFEVPATTEEITP